MQNICQKYTLAQIIMANTGRLGAMLLLVVFWLSCSKNNTAPAHFKIYNKGEDGNTVGNLVVRLDKDVLALKPNLVIIMVGTNDVTNFVPFAQFKTNLARIINSIKNTGANVILMSPPPRGVDVISYPQYELNDKTDTVAQIDSALSKQLNCYYLDINKAFKDAGTPNPTATSLINNVANNPGRPDGVHPTAKGMRFIATNLFNFIQANLPVTTTDNIKVVCFGDSITWGAGSELSYPSQLDKLLNK
jgi:lysophospholipase L1-like esterase